MEGVVNLIKVLKNRKTGTYYSGEGRWTSDLNHAQQFSTLSDAREQGELLSCKDCIAVLKIGENFEAIAMVETMRQSLQTFLWLKAPDGKLSDAA